MLSTVCCARHDKLNYLLSICFLFFPPTCGWVNSVATGWLSVRSACIRWLHWGSNNLSTTPHQCIQFVENRLRCINSGVLNLYPSMASNGCACFHNVPRAHRCAQILYRPRCLLLALPCPLSRAHITPGPWYYHDRLGTVDEARREPHAECFSLYDEPPFGRLGPYANHEGFGLDWSSEPAAAGYHFITTWKSLLIV